MSPKRRSTRQWVCPDQGGGRGDLIFRRDEAASITKRQKALSQMTEGFL